jgi:wobble nucleotide-excising tRNase
MNKVACYKESVTLSTDKKINLIYGLNGTGKSIISDYLYHYKSEKSKEKYPDCKIKGLSDENILVYNQSFIKDYFYESDNLKGIFTLSKENKVAETKIRESEQEKKELDKKLSSEEDNLNSYNKKLQKKEENIKDKAWEIKSTYVDRSSDLEYCFKRLMGSKEALLSHLLKIENPPAQPAQLIDQLKKQAKILLKDEAIKYAELSSINNISIINDIESNKLLQKEIVGNKNSTISELIEKLNNSDWVKKGLDYIPKEIHEKDELCPFCQKQTITKELVNNISDYFDEAYKNDLEKINNFLKSYKEFINSIPQQEEHYKKNQFIAEKQSEFENLYNAMINCLENNKTKIEDKIKSPSQKIYLDNPNDLIESFNDFIVKINKQTSEYNKKIDNKKASLEETKNLFWNKMRWDYNQPISDYQKDKKEFETEIQKIKEKISSINNEIDRKKQEITEQQKRTINIDEAIRNINQGLVDLAIESFSIKKDSNTLYRIIRSGEEKVFLTLSEGEKMIISFLYFIELCKGKQSEADINENKIVIIDDPISSLSHIYVFDIAQIIKSNFINNSEYSQVFILTHSLYFFHELIKILEKKDNCKLFRLIKNKNGSELKGMNPKEIQNDYQSFWQIVKDPEQHPALIANCMRHIIEYFFCFVENIELKKCDIKELDTDKYRAFLRYINRESHSDGINIFDNKEFSYNYFKEAFELVFRKSGYTEHYKKMIS